MARIVYARSFARDLERDAEHLRRIQEPGWITTLQEDLTELERMLAHFPEAGARHAQRGTRLLLRARTRRAPFYVWYAYDTANGPDGEVPFFRLFHTRQQTTQPRFP